MRGRVFAATAAVGGACAIFRRPADGRPSIADALALTPALPALVRADRAERPPSSSRLDSFVLDARSGYKAHGGNGWPHQGNTCEPENKPWM